MKIYTSYFANLRNIPDDIVPIAICCKLPKGYSGLEYPVLAPSSALLSEWHRNHNESYYRQVYCNKLNRLNVHSIIGVLEYLSKGKDIVLLCYERPEKFCHRHLVAEWLNKHGYDVKEWEGDMYET